MIQYVELSASNCRPTTKQILLPTELLYVTDEDIQMRATVRIRAPFVGIESKKILITIDQNNDRETIELED